MKDLRFPEHHDPERDFWQHSDNCLTINVDPQYDEPGRILIGLWKHGEFQNIVLDDETALRFAKAIHEHFGIAETGQPKEAQHG